MFNRRELVTENRNSKAASNLPRHSSIRSTDTASTVIVDEAPSAALPLSSLSLLGKRKVCQQEIDLSGDATRQPVKKGR